MAEGTLGKVLVGIALAVLIFIFVVVWIIPWFNNFRAAHVINWQIIFNWVLFIAFVLGISAVIFFIWTTKKKAEAKEYSIFENKSKVSANRIRQLIVKKFAEFGCEVRTTIEGFLWWQKETWWSPDIIFGSHQRRFFYRNQPVVQLDFFVTKGIYSNRHMMVQAPQNYAEQDIYPDWNVTMWDCTLPTMKFERNNYPPVPAMSEAQRMLDEIYQLTQGDPDKLEEMKDLMRTTRGIPTSMIPKTETIEQPAYLYGKRQQKPLPMPQTEESEV